ncbi:MAG: 50S ribosomal protein L18 [Candidatus Micrarchaeaceae archaeon]
MYTFVKKRRKKALTDYPMRVRLLKGNRNRLVIRRSNRGIIVQAVKYSPDGDIVINSARSIELKKVGWEPRRNTPTAYLTGMALAKKLRGNNDEYVLDIGVHTPSKASVLFAAALGAADNGIKLINNIDFDRDRLSGKHIGSYISKGAKGNQFSLYKKSGIDAAKIESMFENAKKKLSE